MYSIESNSYCNKQITVFIDKFDEGVKYGIKEKCDGLYIRKTNMNDRSFFDLSLLEGFAPYLTHLSFESTLELFDKNRIDGIYGLSKLKSIFLPEKHPVINLEKNVNIEIITTYLLESILNLDKLSNLNLLHLRGHLKNVFPKMKKIPSVRKILIVSSDIDSLHAIDKFDNLDNLELSYNTELKNIIDISKLKLKELKIVKCKYLNSLDELKYNGSIESLYCDVIDNLDFLRTLKKIKKIGFSNVKSGDLRVLLEIPTLQSVSFYPNRKHYGGFTEKYINEILAERSSD